jgi:hypothetical protein
MVVPRLEASQQRLLHVKPLSNGEDAVSATKRNQPSGDMQMTAAGPRMTAVVRGCPVVSTTSPMYYHAHLVEQLNHTLFRGLCDGVRMVLDLG